MSVTVSSRPSAWSAVKNPVVYKIRRDDHTFDSQASSGGFVRITFLGVNLTAYYVVGNTVGYYTGSTFKTGTITASSLSGSDTLVTTDIPYWESTGGGTIFNLSKRTDYRVEVEVFDAADDESLTAGVVFSFTPANDGLVYADISSVVKAFLVPDWSAPGEINETEGSTSKEIYIKYQEYYDGALIGSQTSDSANTVQCVFGALQIPSTVGNNLAAYVPGDDEKQFLTVFDTPVLWRGFPATLSFIFVDVLTLGLDMRLSRIQYDASGAAVSSPVEDIERLKLHYEFDHNFDSQGNSGGFVALVLLDVDVTSYYQVGNTISYRVSDTPKTGTITASIVDGGGDSIITTDIPYWGSAGGGTLLNVTKNPANNYPSVNRINLFDSITLEDDTTVMRVQLKSASAGSEILTNGTFTGSLSGWTQDGIWYYSGDTAAYDISVGNQNSGNLKQTFAQQPIGYYYLEVLNMAFTSGGTTVTFTVECYLAGVLVQTLTSLDVAAAANINQVVYISTAFDELRIRGLADITAANTFSVSSVSLKPQVYADYSAPLDYDVKDACDNPVLLFWKNSLGGDAWWLFDGGQESGYNFSGTKKAKRLTLFADHLTLDQWEALNELNTLGEVYQENITEFTSSVNKTAVRDGAQVYVIDEDGNKTGVIVIPSTSVINTRDVTHSIEIEIEYPERVE